MAFLRVGVSAVALLVVGAAWSQAQTTHANVIVAPHGRARIAGIAPPPPPPPQQSPATYGPTIFANLPVVIMPDGQVFVDLGNGYQEVARACPYAYGYGCESQNIPSDRQPTVFQSYVPASPPLYEVPWYAPRQYDAPTYASPPRPVAVYGSSPVATPRGYVMPRSVVPPRRGVVHR